eukprot:403333601
MITLLLIMIFQSQIRAIVCANFIKKGLIISKQENRLNTYSCSGTRNQNIMWWHHYIQQFKIKDINSFTGFHWFVVSGVDILQSILILISSHYIIKSLRKTRAENDDKFGLFEDDKSHQCLEQQIKRLSIFYLAFAFADVLLLIIGNVIDNNESEVFTCVDNWYLLYEETPAVIFTLFHSLFFMLFSIQIWYIFYRLPYNHGLIKKLKTENLRMTNNYKSTLTINPLKESEVVEEFVKATQQSEIAPSISPLFRKTSMVSDTNTKTLASPKLQNRAYTMINGKIGKNNTGTQITTSAFNYKLSNINLNLNSSDASTAGFQEVMPEIDDNIRLSQNQPLLKDSQGTLNNSPTREHNVYQPVSVLNSNPKRKKKYDMFNKPEMTGSVYSKKRNNTQYDNQNN